MRRVRSFLNNNGLGNWMRCSGLLVGRESAWGLLMQQNSRFLYYPAVLEAVFLGNGHWHLHSHRTENAHS